MTNNTMTTIQGAPRRYEEQELKRRQDQHRNAYLQTRQCMQLVRGEISYNFLTSVLEHANKGYMLSPNLPITTDALSYSCYMAKPSDLTEAEMLNIDSEVKQAYIAELKKELQQYKTLLTQQLLEADALKEQKKEEAKKARRLVEIEAEVNGCFGTLAISD